MLEFGSDWSLPRKEQAFRFEVSVRLRLYVEVQLVSADS
jgi:hypothetical protein